MTERKCYCGRPIAKTSRRRWCAICLERAAKAAAALRRLARDANAEVATMIVTMKDGTRVRIGTDGNPRRV